jgi:hypothetical protein
MMRLFLGNYLQQLGNFGNGAEEYWTLDGAKSAFDRSYELTP